MPDFADLESIVSDSPPDREQLQGMVEALHDILTQRYIQVRFHAFFEEKYPGGNATLPKEELILPFRTNMTEEEDQELLDWCKSSASAWIEEINARIDLLTDKNDMALQDCAVDMSELAVMYIDAYSSAKMHIVVTKFESWNDAAGEAIKENYSNHLKNSTSNQAAMVIALSNSAHLDSAIVRKTCAHIKAMTTNASVALHNGVGVDPGITKVVGWLSLIAGAAAFSPAAAGIVVAASVQSTMTMVNWLASGAKEMLAAVPMETQDEPHLDDTDPDLLKKQMSDAFDRVEQVIKSDRETLAGDLKALFGAFKSAATDGDPISSSQIVPNPNGLSGSFGG